MTWTPTGAPQHIGVGTRQYLQSSHSHEGGHDVAVAGVTVRVLPDGRTTPRQRSQAISDALQTIAAIRAAGEGAVAVDRVDGGDTQSRLEGFDDVAYLVGYLITARADRIEIDGVPLYDEPEARGEWKIVLSDDGSVKATWLGADR